MRRRWRERETLYVLGAVFSVGIVLGWPVITRAVPRHRRTRSDDAHAPRHLLVRQRPHRAGHRLDRAATRACRCSSARSSSPRPCSGSCARRTFPTPSHRDTALLSLLPSIAVLAALALFPSRRIALVLLARADVRRAVRSRSATGIPCSCRASSIRPTPLIAAMQRLQAREPPRSASSAPAAALPERRRDVRARGRARARSDGRRALRRLPRRAGRAGTRRTTTRSGTTPPRRCSTSST